MSVYVRTVTLRDLGDDDHVEISTHDDNPCEMVLIRIVRFEDEREVTFLSIPADELVEAIGYVRSAQEVAS